MNKIIVAEVSKTWYLGRAIDEELLSQKFEKVINTNDKRGYELHEWKTHVAVEGGNMNETIIAIFKLKSK